MKALKIIAVILFFSMIGCASGGDKYLASHAFSDPIEAISILHPVEIEKAGIKSITIFQIVMDPGLFTEVVASSGVWPITAYCGNAKAVNSYAYLRDVTYWGDFVLQAEFYQSKEHLNGCKFIYFNRDAGYAYTLSGVQIPEKNQVEKNDDGKVAYYDSREYDKDSGYRKDLFEEFGISLKGLDEIWIDYFSSDKRGGVPENFTSIFEIEVGSEGWKKYRETIERISVSNPRMPDGQIRTSFIPMTEFKKLAVHRPGYDVGQRMLKNGINIPFGLSSFAIANMGIATGVGLLGNAISASIDDDWEDKCARCKSIRYDLAPLFRYVVLTYKNLLYKRDLLIDELIERNQGLTYKLYYTEER